MTLPSEQVIIKDSNTWSIYHNSSTLDDLTYNTSDRNDKCGLPDSSSYSGHDLPAMLRRSLDGMDIFSSCGSSSLINCVKGSLLYIRNNNVHRSQQRTPGPLPLLAWGPTGSG